MDRSLLDSIRQQSDDLRDELKELEEWEEEVGKKKKKTGGVEDEVVVPIRGSVPSLKDAVQAQVARQGKTTATNQENDPVFIAKERGNEYFRAGKISDAIHSYSTGIELAPEGPSAHILYANRAMCHLRNNQWDKAESDASECVKLDKGYAKGYFRRAMARKSLGKLKEARSDLEAVLALAPNDTTANTELQVVTKMLQVERAKSQEGGQTVKKKITIVEVDDDDDDDGDGNEGGAAAPIPAPTVPDVEVDQAREERVKAQMEELERVRKEEEEKRKKRNMEDEVRLQSRQKQRSSNKVEIIEEVEEETASPASSSSPPPAHTAKPETEEPPKRHPEHHVDPVPSEQGQEEEPQAKPQPQSVPTRPPGRVSVDVAQRLRRKPTKESLTPPKTFTEFERVFAEVQEDTELCAHYISLLNPAGIPRLFGYSLEPEMLVGILKALGSLPATSMFQYLKGLSGVSRIGDITLFFNEGEKKLITDLLELAKEGGAPEKEWSAVKKNLQP